MFKSLKQKWESEKVETSSLSSDSDITSVNPSLLSIQQQQFDESSNNSHKRSNSNVSIVSESEVGNKRSNGGTITGESILGWMNNVKRTVSSQEISNNKSNNQRLPASVLSNSSSLLRPNSRSSVTLNESFSPSITTTTTNAATTKGSESLNERLAWENTKLREQVKELTRKLKASTTDGKPDQIDDKLLKMVGELIVKESSESNGTNHQPKAANGGLKTTSGNWSSLLLPPGNSINTINGDQHKQEIDKLQKRINELEETLREKNKTIRLQQQRINDIRKSFQKGSTLDNKLFDFPGNQNENESSPTSTIDGSSAKNLTISRSENDFIDQVNQPNHRSHHQRQLSDSQSSLNCPMNEISWQYLRSVIFKFVLTSDYEAQKHLVKAIAMILHFSDAEEKQIRDSLEQKVSWFKNLPLLGNGFKHNHHNSNHH